MYYKAELSEVYKEVNSSELGLTTIEAKNRLAIHGQNKLTEKKQKNGFVKFLSQFKDFMVIFLLLAAVASLIIGIVMKSNEEFFDAIIIAIIVFINALVGFLQEGKAEKALLALKKMSEPFATVLRDGEVVKIKTEDVVIGDIVVLEAGDVVCADLRLIETIGLKIEESALTGESVPSEKDINAKFTKEEVPIADRKNMAYSSCTVTVGRGRGIVVRTGMQTETGKIATMLNTVEDEITPLQKKLDSVGKIITIGVLIIALIIFVTMIITHLENIDALVIIRALETAVVIAVAAIPEGLPAVITVVMSFGILKLSKKNAIVKQLTAIETLGSTEIICTDKTGTLTLNKMTVKQIETFNNVYQLAPKKPIEAYINDKNENLTKIFYAMMLCNDSLVKTNGNKFDILGDPTETALVYCAMENNLNKLIIEKENKRVDEKPFDSIRKIMSTVNQNKNGKTVYCKGGVDEVLAICSKIMIDGKEEILTQTLKNNIISKNEKMAESALRVLGYATKKYIEGDAIETELTFVGLSGMIDPPREEVKDAIALCKQAGISVVMITGDHKNTAIAIAKKIGIMGSGDEAISGKDLDKLSDTEFAKRVLNIKVYARVSPENKVRIVQTLRAKDKVVAMTGDGVNDAPSIKSADIGIGMGITGTEVTKAAANMILADDNFGTIVTAVSEGRKIFANIQKAILFLLSGNMCEVLALFIVVLFFPNLSFLVPVQILWVNLITDSFPALAFSTCSAGKDLLTKPPRKKNASLFSEGNGIKIFLQGILQTVLVLTSFFIGLAMFDNKIAITMALITLNFVQLFNIFNVASGNQSMFISGVFKNIIIIGAFFIGAILTSCIILIPFFQTFFQTTSISLVGWVIALSLAFVIIPTIELSKIFINIYKNKKNGNHKKKTNKIKMINQENENKKGKRDRERKDEK